jgi:hypothetical protein
MSLLRDHRGPADEAVRTCERAPELGGPECGRKATHTAIVWGAGIEVDLCEVCLAQAELEEEVVAPMPIEKEK